MSKINLDGVIMSCVATAEAGTVDAKTLFYFRQKGDLITAKYRGGKVLEGFLIGRL